MLKGIPTIVFSKGGVECGYRYSDEIREEDAQEQQEAGKKKQAASRK
jgi:hypothetical protein